MMGLPAGWGVPAYQRRAPLRRGTPAVLDRGIPRCSRLSTAGSIAASSRRPCSQWRTVCSRLSTAGSIAARSTPRSASVTSTVFPPINGGLHCGGVTGTSSPSAKTVFPPINGGLHCGTQMPGQGIQFRRGVPAYQRRAPLRPAVMMPAPLRSGGCSRLSTAGSIAARWPGCRLRRRRHRVPAYQRRAPLRQDGPGERYAQVLGCSRLSTAGSIAAMRRRCQPMPWCRCSRLSTAGSIAATSPPPRGRGRRPVFPPINGGLHCGLPRGPHPARAVRRVPAYQRRAPLRP